MIGLLVSLIVFILPVWLIKPEAIDTLKPWILVCLGVLASITQPSYKPLGGDATAEDKGTANQLVWTVYISMLLGIIECLKLRYPSGLVWDYLSITFLAISIFGSLFRAWSVAVLGRYFTWHIKIQPGQKVIKTGPYSLVRHPSYTGAWLLYVAALLFIQAWFSAILAAVLLYIAFRRRIKYEEAILVRSFGDEYTDYSKKVKRLIPMVW